MALQDKYAKLIQYAQASSVEGLSATEQNNVLYVSGKATGAVKDKLWDIYNEIDPDMRSADLVLNIEVIPGTESDDVYEVKAGDSLSKIAARYPGVTWNQIFEANKDQIKDPNLIHPGQKLRIPK
jgi:nucleoid-associated protein YgaU